MFTKEDTPQDVVIENYEKEIEELNWQQAVEAEPSNEIWIS